MPKYLFTLNMPSSQGNRDEDGRWDKLVHQVIGEHPAPTLEHLLNVLHENDYIVVRQMYKTPDRDENNKMIWEERDDLIINMQHVGKIQKYEDRSTTGFRRPYANVRDRYER